MKKLDLLFEIVKGVRFYRDINDTDKYYTEFKNFKGKKVFTAIDSEEFKSYLFAKAIEFDEVNEILDPQKAVQQLLYLLKYQKNFSEVEVFTRTSGGLTSYVEYDLQRDDQQTVVITREGWELSQKRRKFVTSKASLPQVIPTKTTKSPLELLKNFVNIKGNSFALFVAWLIQGFLSGSHYILWVVAERGSAKTTLCKIIKRLIDPCKFTVTTIPDKKDDLRVLLNSTHVNCFDNISAISNDVSDLFCGAVSGTSIVKRSLYTDSDINVVSLRNLLVINGIGFIPERDDLAERMMVLKLHKLNEKQLKPEKDLWMEFDEKLPEILGAIFNTISKAMKEIGTVKKENLPRMADSFVEMVAIAKALGFSEDEFRKIYRENQNLLEQMRLGSPVVQAVREYMENVVGRSVEKGSKEMFEEIKRVFSGDKSLLPGSPAHFTMALDNKHIDLLKAGFRANFDDTSPKGTMIKIIKRK